MKTCKRFLGLLLALTLALTTLPLSARAAEPVDMEILQQPDTVSYAIGDTVDLTGLVMQVTYDDGTVRTITSDQLTMEQYDTTFEGQSSAEVSYGGVRHPVPIYVHAGRETVEIDPAGWPESDHNYGNDEDDTQVLSVSGAESITVTFSQNTRFENGYDYLYLYDGSHTQLYRFTGSAAAGETVTIPGDTVYFQLVSDFSYTAYGYALTSATAQSLTHTGETVAGEAPDCTTDGHTSGLRCEICGALVGAQVLPALGHSWGDWVQAGSYEMTRTCTVCGDTEHMEVERMFTTPGNSEYEQLDMAQIRAMYDAIDWDMPNSYATAPSASAPYVIGRLTDACLDNLTAQSNFFRRLARLDSVRWEESLVNSAQAASMVNAANDQLSHYPGRPGDMPADIYEVGADGASRSNLAWGTHMGMMESIPAYLDDSDTYNIDVVGHRRWVLNPAMGAIGYGMTGRYHAMYAFDFSNQGNYDAAFVAYPGGNRIYPRELFASHIAWSVQLCSAVFQTPSMSQVRVVLTRESDGTQWVFSAQESDGFFNVDHSGCGDGSAVIFLPDGVGAYEGVYTVMITGLHTRSGETAAIEYAVDFRSLEDTDVHEHTPGIRDAREAACLEEGYTGDTYCTDCGELIAPGQTIAPLGHSYVEGVCQRCGEQQLLAGDVNGDGTVNSDDAIHLLYHTLFGDSYAVNQDCDFNGDGGVDSDDAIHLLYHTLFGEAMYPLNH